LNIYSAKNNAGINWSGTQREFDARTAMQTDASGSDGLIDGALSNHAGMLSGRAINYS
jgi:S1-C subfamily serine protease